MIRWADDKKTVASQSMNVDGKISVDLAGNIMAHI